MIRTAAITSATALGLIAALGTAWADAPMRAISGEVIYFERIALPDDAELVVAFRARDGSVLAEDRSRTEGRQVPLPFRVWVPANRTGQLVGEIEIAGEPAWRSAPVPVEAGTGAVTLGEVRLERVPGFEPAAAEPEAPPPVVEPLAEAEPEPAPAPDPDPAPAPAPPVAEEPAAMPEEGQVVYLCGEDLIVAAFDGEAVTLTVGETMLELEQVPTASGARYEASNDPETFFWSRGDRALVSLAGVELPECVQQDTEAAPEGDAAAEPPFRAAGNEPFWSLQIGEGRLVLRPSLDAEPIDVAAPAPEQTDGEVVYRLPEADVTIRLVERVCRDTMSGMPFPVAATVETQDGAFEGCGGEPYGLLEGEEWQVESVEGEPVGGAEVTIAFLPERRIAGTGGCNRYMGGVELTGESLTFGQVASTMMACSDERMALERRFFDTIARISLFDIGEDGELLLLEAEQPVIVARR